MKTFKASTGLYYPTPIGKFTILNKAVNAFSSIYNVWMPYWMAFSYGSDVNAYFGIHELAYAEPTNGATPLPIPQTAVNEPSTGGCVALAHQDAKEVYAFADIGTPVVIFQ